METENELERFPILRISQEGRSRIEEAVARELPLTIILNGKELVTLLASPGHLDFLAVGFLSSEGLLDSKDEIKRVTVDAERGVVRVETTAEREFSEDVVFKRIISSGCGRGASFYSAADVGAQKVESRTKISFDEVSALAMEFQHKSELYLATHGVHSAALCDNKGIMVFS